MSQRYVLGFAFHELTPTCLQAVLIRKARPEWQRGMLNGVGGKIEFVDYAPANATVAKNVSWWVATGANAMAREFHEETDVLVGVNRWQWFKTEAWRDTGAVMECFATVLTEQEFLSLQMNHTDEPLETRLLHVNADWHVLNPQEAYAECLYNLPYLIQNALIHLKVEDYGKCIKV